MRENPTFGNRVVPVSRSGKLRSGASPPDVATAASCDGEARRKIAKSRIFPHMGRGECVLRQIGGRNICSHDSPVREVYPVLSFGPYAKEDENMTCGITKNYP